MEWITGWPALIKVIVCFTIILALNRAKLNLGFALLIGAGFLAAMMGMSATGAVSAMLDSILDTQFIGLIIIVGVILVLSKLMAGSGQLNRIVDSFTGLVHSVRLTTLVMPALIGLLPMPGGALFSAPMVEAACSGNNSNPELKTALNYWFRHIWEVWWPMYPGVVLAVTLLHVPVWKFILGGLPLTVAALLGGIIFLWPKLPSSCGNEEETEGVRQRLAQFSREVRPITLIVISVPGVKLIEWAVGISMPPLTAVYVGLGLCLVYVIVKNRISANTIMKAATDKSIPPLLFLIVGIMAFKGMLVGSLAVNVIQAELAAQGIPMLLVILIMPFLSGFITGVALGFVGASFPLVAPLIADKTGVDFMAYAALAYGFGWLGMMLSPVHLCFLMTKDYFHAGLLGSYRYIAAPAVLFAGVALGLFGLTRLIV